MAKYQRVRAEGNEAATKFVLSGFDGSENFVHEIPVQAFGDRMELFGIDTDDAVELVGMASRAPQEYDQHIPGVVASYKDLVETEAAGLVAEPQTAQGRVLNQVSSLRPDGRDPAVSLSVNRSSSTQVDTLNQRRRRGLESLRVHNYTRNTQSLRTQTNHDRAVILANALNCEPDAARELRERLGGMQELISAFQVHTAVTMVPKVERAIDLIRQ